MPDAWPTIKSQACQVSKNHAIIILLNANIEITPYLMIP